MTQRSASPIVAIALGVALMGGTALSLSLCKKSEDKLPESAVRGTVCQTILDAPRARPVTPLPAEPALAAWTERVEDPLEAHLALEGMWNQHDPHGPPLEPNEAECVRQLWSTVTHKMPERSRMRTDLGYVVTRLLSTDGARDDAPAPPADSAPVVPKDMHLERTEAHVRDSECDDLQKFLEPFPANARLRRALTLHFIGCVEDNFNSMDGPLDKAEGFMRATVESWPERAGLDFALLAAADDGGRPAGRSANVWLGTAFGRVTLDLGPTGNALHVARDLCRGKPEMATRLLPTAPTYATGKLPAFRRARWAGLAAYLEAGAPDPSNEDLLRALADDGASRWALAWIPNELEEHAPEPYPYIRDAALIAAVEKRMDAVTTNEDIVLALDAVSRMPPGTALAAVVRAAASKDEGVWSAALSAMQRQIMQLPSGITIRTPKDIDDDRQFRRDPSKLLAPHLAALHASLAPRVCTSAEAITFLASAKDPDLDAALASCIEAMQAPPERVLAEIFSVCQDRREIPWTKTASALKAVARPGPNDDYARRVAEGCRTGKN